MSLETTKITLSLDDCEIAFDKPSDQGTIKAASELSIQKKKELGSFMFEFSGDKLTDDFVIKQFNDQAGKFKITEIWVKRRTIITGDIEMIPLVKIFS